MSERLYDIDSETECWLWRGTLTAGGYSQMAIDGRRYYGHRIAYQLHRGSIGRGREIDHLCRNRACVNPAHLESVTLGENVLRGESLPAQNGRKDACVRGHEFTLENTYRRPNGGRVCLTCRRALGRAFHERHRERRNARRRKVSVASAVLAFAFFSFYALPGAIDNEFAHAAPRAASAERTVQGKGVVWWSKRAVQARRDANARGLTIRRLQASARRQLAYPTGHWLDGAFLCIHRYERGAGGWQTATGNGYRGGLQFDSSFAHTYGPAWAFRAFGGVERWPASVQIAAAIQAWTSRGFGPWPSTRLRCGL